MKTRHWLALAALFLLVYLAMGLQYFLAVRNAPVQKVGLEDTRCQVVSIPAGAQVSVDAGTLGSPVTPTELTGCTYTTKVTISHPGYETRILQPPGLGQVVLLRPLPLTRLAFHFPLLLAVASLLLARRSREESGDQQLVERSTERMTMRILSKGARVGDYKLESLVGKGAMAAVFRAHDAEGTRVAMKILSEDACQGPEMQERFQREAEICRALRHPGIVSVLAHGTHENRLWMAQSFIEGSSLDRQSLPFPWPRVVELLIGIGEALHYAHEAGVVHRDLKPGNILLDGEGRPVISDFGLARADRYLTITKTDVTLGTPAYMPPEQVSEGKVDRRADLYSLGCIACELLTGQVPFPDLDVVPTLMAHLTEPAPRVDRRDPAIPTGLADVVARLLAKDPADRYPSAADLVQDLRSLASSSAT